MSVSAIPLYAPIGNGTARAYVASRGNNSLFQTATQTSDRKNVVGLDGDIHRTVTNLGRRTMMQLGRKIFADCRAIGAAVEEKAELAGSTFLPQYYGATRTWGDQAEAWMEQHDKIIDVAGAPFDMRNYRRLLPISVMRDGDMLTVLVKNNEGYPMIQCVPAHRVGSVYDLTTVRGGEFDGARIIDGVIINDANRVIAYRINIGENPYDFTKYLDVSTRDAFLSFIPRFYGQVRGFSELGMVAFECLDVKETDKWQRLQSKISSQIGLIERNELGESPPPGYTGVPVTSDTANQFSTETMPDGTQVRYFKTSDPNAGLEILANKNPSVEQQSQRHSILRDIFSGLGWSIDFALDPTKIGGASARFMIDRINRSLCTVQDLILRPACSRIDGFRVSSAIQIKLLPPDPDWWKWEYQGPARLTADKKYDSEVDAAEEQRGYVSRKQVTARRGNYIEDIDRAKEDDAVNKWAAAERIAGRFNLDITAAYNSLWNPQPNGLAPTQPETIEETAAPAMP